MFIDFQPVVIIGVLLDHVTQGHGKIPWVDFSGGQDVLAVHGMFLSIRQDVTPTFAKGGFHELHNEPDGVKEKVIGECIAWVEAHLSSGRTAKL